MIVRLEDSIFRVVPAGGLGGTHAKDSRGSGGYFARKNNEGINTFMPSLFLKGPSNNYFASRFSEFFIDDENL